MNKKTEYYVKRVKFLTKEWLKLNKERDEIKNGLISKDSSWNSGLADAVNDDRNKRISKIDEELSDIDVELFVIKNAALRQRGAKLSPSAKMAGFITNDAYADYEYNNFKALYGDKIRQYLSRRQKDSSKLDNLYFDEISDIASEMNSKEANKISRR